MIRKSIGIILVIGAVGLAVVLLIGSKLIFPHVIGPITLAGIGVVLLIPKKRTDNSAK